MRLLPWRRRDRLHTIGEAEAYHHAYGERTTEVKQVKLPPRRKRFQLPISGEELRRRFEERLSTREEEER
jgi:hypothetical protein